MLRYIMQSQIYLGTYYTSKLTCNRERNFSIAVDPSHVSLIFGKLRDLFVLAQSVLIYVEFYGNVRTVFCQCLFLYRFEV